MAYQLEFHKYKKKTILQHKRVLFLAEMQGNIKFVFIFFLKITHNEKKNQLNAWTIRKRAIKQLRLNDPVHSCSADIFLRCIVYVVPLNWIKKS